MAASRHVLALDQGTTSTRAIVFDAAGRAVATAQAELAQSYPADGWVEQDGEAIWRDARAVLRDAVAQAGLRGADIAAIGIANQRETTLLWDRRTGALLHPAIGWQDRRTAAACARLREAGAEPLVRARTGLLLDPYFSATKLAWLLDHVTGARARAAAGALAFGTVDSFLLWRLTGGRVHATDATNASRTLLFDIHRQRWDPELLDLFGVPAALLPEVRDSSMVYGETGVLGDAIPVAGLAGDQQAALVGQGCFEPGSAKATYGTGAFLLLNTGGVAVASEHRLLATVAYRLGGVATYAVEGAIFAAGSTVQWLRDALGLVAAADETATLAATVPDNGGVHLVPAFTGLGAPHWAPEARGLVTGLTFATQRAHLARAALEAVGYQSADLLAAMRADGAAAPAVLRVDGGMAANDWLCRFLADLLDIPVERAATLETTARGAAFLAGLAVGVWPDLTSLARLTGWARRFEPAMAEGDRARLLAGWQAALRRALPAR